MLRTVFVALVATLFVGFAGCEMPEPPAMTEGDVYLDNGSDQAIVVEIDGRERGTVLPGQFKKIPVSLGERHFVITSGDSVVYDAKHALDVGNRPRVRPAFMLNPDHSFRYCRVSVVYGNDSLTRGAAGGLASLITRVASKQAVGSDPAEQKKWIAEQERERKFRSIVNSMTTFGDQPLSRFTSAQHILKPMPNIVIGRRHSYSEKRSTVIRVPAELHESVRKASLIEQPTDADVDQVAALKDLVESYISYRLLAQR